jgi:hypothetical protein
MEADESGKVDVIVETYNITDVVVGIQATSGICEEHRLDSEKFAHSHGVRDQ